MTAKEKVLEMAPLWSEHDAEIALHAVEREHEDPVIVTFRDASYDDEPWTDEDEAAVKEADADIAAGRTISHQEMLRKYG